MLATVAEQDDDTHGLLIDQRKNPLVRIASNAAQDMLKFAGEFGLTPVARSRLAAGLGGQPTSGKFDGLIG